MKEYKLLSLDEYDNYLKWKNNTISTLDKKISKNEDNKDQNITQSGEFKDNISNINSNNSEIETNLNNKTMDRVIESESEFSKSDTAKNDSESMDSLPLPPPGIPLNMDKTENISYKQNGERSEWIRYWRKSIR